MRYQLLALSLSISTSLFGAKEMPSPAIAPPLKLELRIEGKTYEVSTSAILTADISGKKVEVVISEKPTKTFHYSGVAFEFPKNHAYAFQEVPNLDLWNLSGSKNSIMVLMPKAEAKAVMDSMIKSLVQKYGEKNTKLVECEQAFGNVKIMGKRLTAILAQERIVQELYLVTNGKNEIIVVLQDSPQNEGSETAETSAVKKLLMHTFNFKE